MKEKPTKRTYKHTMTASDWERFNNMTDDEIDTSDIPDLDEDFWKNARVVFPKKKKSIALRVDEDLLSWFKNEGRGYQSRMLAVLRSYMQAHQANK